MSCFLRRKKKGGGCHSGKGFRLQPLPRVPYVSAHGGRREAPASETRGIRLNCASPCAAAGPFFSVTYRSQTVGVLQVERILRARCDPKPSLPFHSPVPPEAAREHSRRRPERSRSGPGGWAVITSPQGWAGRGGGVEGLGGEHSRICATAS